MNFKAKRNENEQGQKPNDRVAQRRKRETQPDADDQSQSFTNRRMRKKINHARRPESKTPNPRHQPRPKSTNTTSNERNSSVHQEKPERRKTRYFFPTSSRSQTSTTAKSTLEDSSQPQAKVFEVYTINNRQTSDDMTPISDFDKTIYESFYELVGSTR